MQSINIIELLKDNKDYFEDYITRSIYNSNAIEGSTLSYEHIYAIVFNNPSFKISATPREIYEAINHKYALKLVLDNLQDTLDAEFIIHLAKTINKDIDEASGFKSANKFIRGSKHKPPSSKFVRNKMLHFVDNYNNSKYDSIFAKIAYNHIEFERIHLFLNGNARAGRLLINFELLKNNIAPAIIQAEDKSKYFEFLQKFDSVNFAKYLESLSKAEMQRIMKLSITQNKEPANEKNRTTIGGNNP
jgi:Fic family protein